MRILKYKRAITVIVSVGLLLTVGTISSIAQAYDSVDYFPLGSTDEWYYTDDDDVVVDITKAVSGTEDIITPVETKVITYSNDNRDYFTNDDVNGLKRYGYYVDNFPINFPPYLTCSGPITVTFDPAIPYVEAVMGLGDEITESGTATFVFGGDCAIIGTKTLPYGSTSTVGDAIESIDVPLGPFRTITVVTEIDFTGTWTFLLGALVIKNPMPDFIQTHWLAKGVGAVKYDEKIYEDLSDDPLVLLSASLWKLVDTTRPIIRPMPWIPLLLLGD
ncbi:hypothetical protein ACFL6B_04895 [Thermodesulfobacteriota bacterium]